MSFLSTFSKDFKAVFSWLGSSKGQVVIGVVETGIEVAVPAATGAINLVNTWMTEIIKTEALSAAAGQQTGTGATKAAAVLTTVVPQLTQFLTANGYPNLNTTQINSINTALATVLNTLGAAPAVTPAVTPAA